MAGPPTDIPASQLYLALSSATRPNKVVEFPRYDDDGKSPGELRIQILTQRDQMAASTEAERVARKHMKEGKKGDIGYERLYTDALCIEILWRACRSFEDPKYPSFPSPSWMQENLTTEEAAKLFDHYLTVQLELGPMTNQMTEEECEAWIDRLVEGGSGFPLNLLTSEQQQLLLMYMAFQLRPSPTVSVSASEPPGDSLPSADAS
jgi:hypothetical protein